MTKRDLIDVYKDTTQIVTHGFYLNSDDEMVKLPHTHYDDIIMYDRRFTDIDIDADKDTPPVIEIVDDDTLTHAKTLVDKGYHVTVLNMASTYLPGGGVMKGSGAQEEDLFRRTNLMGYLYHLHPIGRDFGFTVPSNHIFYPIDGGHDIIWTPQVAVFKDNRINEFQLLDKPYFVDVITCAAVRKPQLTKDNTLDTNDEYLMRSKIQSILNCAALSATENNALVLGAFGCGAYGNPPKQIAKIFHEEIENCPHINNLDLIHFAIIDSNSVGQKHNPDGNFKPFFDEFNNKTK